MSEVGCCGEVLAGRDCEGIGRTESRWKGKPGKHQARKMNVRGDNVQFWDLKPGLYNPYVTKHTFIITN